METPQSNQPASQNYDLLKSKAIEERWDEFLRQLIQAKPHGFVSESETGIKIYSFESWLRDTGKQSFIQEYCNYIKDSNYMTTAATRFNDLRLPVAQNLRLLVTFLFWALLSGGCLYLLIVAFLATFDISFWGWLPAILFTISGPLVVATALFIQYLRLKRDVKNGTKMKPQYIIKNFDNDELTFLRTKNKLFVEGQ
jgi:hypothetical protein